jgi:hypothetical protein
VLSAQVGIARSGTSASPTNRTTSSYPGDWCWDHRSTGTPAADTTLARTAVSIRHVDLSPTDRDVPTAPSTATAGLPETSTQRR